MKTPLIIRKKPNKTCAALLILSAVGGTCALIAFHLKKQRLLICKDTKRSATAPQRSASAGCQHVGQNAYSPPRTDINANSPEWERNIS